MDCIRHGVKPDKVANLAWKDGKGKAQENPFTHIPTDLSHLMVSNYAETVRSVESTDSARGFSMSVSEAVNSAETLATKVAAAAAAAGRLVAKIVLRAALGGRVRINSTDDRGRCE